MKPTEINLEPFSEKDLPELFKIQVNEKILDFRVMKCMLDYNINYTIQAKTEPRKWIDIHTNYRAVSFKDKEIAKKVLKELKTKLSK
jgi:hypothetical protein